MFPDDCDIHNRRCDMVQCRYGKLIKSPIVQGLLCILIDLARFSAILVTVEGLSILILAVSLDSIKILLGQSEPFH